MKRNTRTGQYESGSDSFMQAEITEKQYWYELDTSEGTQYVAEDWTGRQKLRARGGESREIPTAFRDFCTGGLCYSIERVYGYGVRLSAAGYLDCTDWCVFTNKREAQHYAAELSSDE